MKIAKSAIPFRRTHRTPADCRWTRHLYSSSDHPWQDSFAQPDLLKGQHLKVLLDTQRAQLTVYVRGRIFKRWAYLLLKH